MHSSSGPSGALQAQPARRERSITGVFCDKLQTSAGGGRPRVGRSANRLVEGSVMVARMASYRFKADPTELAKKVEGGLIPIFMKQPGFRDYSLFADTRDLEEAAAGVDAAWAWVRENMSDELEWADTKFVDVLLSTSFGVSPSWEDPKERLS